MENKRKIPKRIFSFFLAILCTFGILFVSYIPSFADYFQNITFSIGGLSPSRCQTMVGYYNEDNTWIVLRSYNSNPPGDAFSVDYPSGVPILIRALYSYSNYYQFDIQVNGTYIMKDNTPLYTRNSPFVVSSLDSLVFTPQTTYGSSSLSSAYILYQPATPTPVPATPSPAPATPTPNPYGPGPVPTIPPGEQSYTDFFTRLASDAQSAFNAIFLSWNNANTRFYSGIFFIGFPILLGIIGLVASIFFGDDD